MAPAPAAPAMNDGRRGRARWGLVVFWLLLILIAGAVWVYRQPIRDWVALQRYEPPAAVKQLADQDTMTDYARRMFYLNQPELLSSVDGFRKACPDSRDTVVLGCYHPDQQGIYIYNVKDPDLQGIVQVTAAHEDLHAIYDRLSGKDRRYVDDLLKDYYEHGLKDDRVKSEIELYKKTEPNDVVNEMHSTFGTEIAELPPALEAYYKRYFANRAAIVAYEQHYEQAFSARQAVVRADDARLADIKSQIESRQAGLNDQLAQVRAAKQELDELLSAGQTEAYNSRVASYNASVSSYNSSVSDLRKLIEEYNQLVATRNSVANQLNVLSQAIDTRVPQQIKP